MAMNYLPPAASPVWLDPTSCSLETFRSFVERTTEASDVPLASTIIANIPVYNAAEVRRANGDPTTLRAFMAEWHQVFLSGAGIVIIRNGFEDLKSIDHVTGVLDRLIVEERQSNGGKGDHFAAAGSNSRLWNAHEKLCMADPEAFVRYNANPIIPLISRSWLGPHYQITTQVNVVHPGGKAQICHRDYHMGFQTLEELTAYPAHVHWLSAALTLQGAIAHTDMPLETGPTKLLPFSQTYLPGYFATQLPEFRAYFEQNFAQATLAKGDLLFFNPAVFHAAGENKTKDVHRFANLMQIGSGYGRSIEIVDRARMSHHLYPTLAAMKDRLSQQEIDDVIAACAEGYPFPANLDIDSPLGGMAPESQQGLLRRALKEGWDTEQFRTALKAKQERLRSH
jgi:ectoine hydroxylase-related dioxygenase (phytanoyl-CoA dioxygenase family)